MDLWLGSLAVDPQFGLLVALPRRGERQVPRVAVDARVVDHVQVDAGAEVCAAAILPFQQARAHAVVARFIQAFGVHQIAGLTAENKQRKRDAVAADVHQSTAADRRLGAEVIPFATGLEGELGVDHAWSADHARFEKLADLPHLRRAAVHERLHEEDACFVHCP